MMLTTLIANVILTPPCFQLSSPKRSQPHFVWGKGIFFGGGTRGGKCKDKFGDVQLLIVYRFKSDHDETRHDCSSPTEYTSTDGVGFRI